MSLLCFERSWHLHVQWKARQTHSNAKVRARMHVLVRVCCVHGMLVSAGLCVGLDSRVPLDLCVARGARVHVRASVCAHAYDDSVETRITTLNGERARARRQHNA